MTGVSCVGEEKPFSLFLGSPLGSCYIDRLTRENKLMFINMHISCTGGRNSGKSNSKTWLELGLQDLLS